MTWQQQQQHFVQSLLESDQQRRQDLSQSWASQAYGIDIYRNNMMASLSAALKDNYSHTRALVGDEFFSYQASKYVERYGCNTPCVVDYGEHFATFLSEQSELEALAYVAQIAYLERQMRCCSQSQIERQLLSLKQLSCFSEQELQGIEFKLASHAQLLRSQSPVLSLYRYIQDQQQMPSDLHAPELVLLLKQTDFGVSLDPLTEGMFDFLSRLSRGLSLAEIVEFDPQNASRLLLEAIGLDCIAYKD